ncbi:MAG: hypothetical protein NTY98_01570 [Verrucomicrobia bacterium]|nr:hypothetical protein [Verrucomicrobiota bacterium]
MSAQILNLAEEATKLHKALLLGVAILGPEAGRVDDLPDYRLFQVKPLKRLIEDLDRQLMKLNKALVTEVWGKQQRKTVILWLASRHDAWMAAKQPVFEIGRVHEVEAALGPLIHRTQIECPPYAQVILQGYRGAGIRHPEYHLSRDLSLLNNLFLDAEAITDDHQRNRRPHNNENSQSLARSVILACYNLLESFVSGLVTAFVIENPQADEATLKKLREPDRKRSSLKARWEDIPSMIAQQDNAMAPFKSVFDPLFGECKWRRDAFVHCESGPAPTKFGTVKEIFFHETDAIFVRETVTLTIRAIRAAWKVIYQNEGPRWLPDPDSKGRFPNVEAKLTEVPK